MAKFQDFTNDIEAQDIAEKLQKKFEMFEEHDLTKISFLRVMNKENKDAVKTISFGFPADAFLPFVYVMMVYDKRWQQISDEQRIAAIFQQMVSIEKGGFDIESNNYAKIRRRDVSEYSEVLCAVGMNYNWQEIGIQNVPNILEDLPDSTSNNVENNIDENNTETEETL